MSKINTDKSGRACDACGHPFHAPLCPRCNGPVELSHRNWYCPECARYVKPKCKP